MARLKNETHWPAGAPAASRRAAEASVNQPLLSLRNLEKRYANGTLALQGMNLEVGSHEFVSLLGPSGCGKSSALRMISGLAAPSSGTIAWNAERTADPGVGTPSHDISFVFQEPTLAPWSRVFDNVWLPLRLQGVSRADARDRVEAALATVGLADFAHAYPRELSGGMKMRVSIARAMVTRPRLLLMDEPFAALDEMSRFKLNNDTLALWHRNRFSAIFVTHSVYESVYLSSRIIVMAARPGRVVADIVIDEPYPRSDSFRTSRRYSELCVEVSRVLQTAGGHHE